MRSLLQFIGLGSDARDPETRDTEAVRRISAELDKLDPEEARYLACFAYVLARIAHADLAISQEEIREMERLIQEFSSLRPAQAALVVQMAKTQTITLGATENYLVTRQFRKLSERDQRLELLHCLFAVAAADQSISEIENAEVTQIATELGLTGPEVAAARAEFREHLAVLKDFPSKGRAP